MPFFAEVPFVFFAAVAAIFGLIVGSFLNVVIWRVPRGESIVFPGSHCGNCGAAVKPYDNIPVISYLVLGGKCRACKQSYSWIYPAVELLTGLLFLAVAWKSGPTWVAIAEIAFIAVIVSLIFIDAQHQLLPNVITYPMLLTTLIAMAVLGRLSFSALFENVPELSSYYRFLLTQNDFLVSQVVKLIPGYLLGAFLFALAVPTYWLIDRLDDVLFGKYFEWAEESSEGSVDNSEAELIAQKRHDNVVYGTMIAGLLAAIIWGIWSFRSQPGSTLYTFLGFSFSVYGQAVSNLAYAGIGALVGGGIIWLLRAAYFFTRGFEGMGLGDVKMMGVIGAFLGWQQSILVIMIGSLLGSMVGLVMARRSEDGLKTALPFGIFLGTAAILALFFGQPLVQWYAGRFN